MGQSTKSGSAPKHVAALDDDHMQAGTRCGERRGHSPAPAADDCEIIGVTRSRHSGALASRDPHVRPAATHNSGDSGSISLGSAGDDDRQIIENEIHSIIHLHEHTIFRKMIKRLQDARRSSRNVIVWLQQILTFAPIC